MEQIIFNTKHYKVVIGKDENDEYIYKIVNIRYKVVEADTKLYPQAIKYASDLEASLAALTDITGRTRN